MDGFRLVWHNANTVLVDSAPVFLYFTLLVVLTGKPSSSHRLSNAVCQASGISPAASVSLKSRMILVPTIIGTFTL